MKTSMAAITLLGLGIVGCNASGEPIDGRHDEAPQYAEIDCFASGTVIAAAARQTPAAKLDTYGICTVTTGGGDPVNALFGTVTCASNASTISCTDNATTCAADGASFGPPGTNISVTWTARDVPGGSTSGLEVPGPLSVVPPPTTAVRGQPYTIQFSSGANPGGVLISAAAPVNGSTAIIECLTLSSQGQLVVPGDVTAILAGGTAVNVALYNVDRRSVTAGDFEVDVNVFGSVVGPQSFTVQVQ